MTAKVYMTLNSSCFRFDIFTYVFSSFFRPSVLFGDGEVRGDALLRRPQVSQSHRG